MQRLTILRPDGSHENHPYDPKRHNLEFLQKTVGGAIEPIPLLRRFGDKRVRQAYSNEDGKRLQLPPNEAATKVWWENIRHYAANPAATVSGEVLLGTVVLIHEGGE
jgi:hypothetical protein